LNYTSVGLGLYLYHTLTTTSWLLCSCSASGTRGHEQSWTSLSLSLPERGRDLLRVVRRLNSSVRTRTCKIVSIYCQLANSPVRL